MPTTLPFPAVVTAPDGEHWSMARLRFVGDRLQVFAYSRGAVRLAAETTITETVQQTVERGRPARYHLSSPDGTWVVEKGAGCGCGHPLKRADLDAVARTSAARTG